VTNEELRLGLLRYGTAHCNTEFFLVFMHQEHKMKKGHETTSIDSQTGNYATSRFKLQNEASDVGVASVGVQLWEM
jgi:hypothetical protein